jgi:hypothetical protein
MKRLALIGTVVMVVTLLGVAGFAGAKGDSVDALPEGTFGFIYDGFCDGMTLTFNTGTGITSGTYASSCCTCPMTEDVGGAVGVVFSQGVAFSLSWNPGLGIWTVLRTNRTWTHYYYDGTMMNQGTWTPCPPGGEKLGTGTVPSTFH